MMYRTKNFPEIRTVGQLREALNEIDDETPLMIRFGDPCSVTHWYNKDTGESLVQIEAE